MEIVGSVYLRKSSKIDLTWPISTFLYSELLGGYQSQKNTLSCIYFRHEPISCGQTLGAAGERRHNRDSSQNTIVEREPAQGPRYNQRYPGGISIWCECVHTNNEYLTCWHFLPDTRCVCGKWSGSSSSRQAPCCSHQRRSVRGEGS